MYIYYENKINERTLQLFLRFLHHWNSVSCKKLPGCTRKCPVRSWGTPAPFQYYLPWLPSGSWCYCPTVYTTCRKKNIRKHQLSTSKKTESNIQVINAIHFTSIMWHISMLLNKNKWVRSVTFLIIYTTVQKFGVSKTTDAPKSSNYFWKYFCHHMNK